MNKKVTIVLIRVGSHFLHIKNQSAVLSLVCIDPIHMIAGQPFSPLLAMYLALNNSGVIFSRKNSLTHRLLNFSGWNQLLRSFKVDQSLRGAMTM